MKSVEEKQQFVQLRAQGLSFSKIEEKLGISKKTLISWEPELREEIAKERAKEIEHLKETYWAEKKGRIEFLVERRKRLQEEERTRDLSDVPTAKVMQLELQTSEQLKKEKRSLSTQTVLGALGSSLPANASEAVECSTSMGSADEGSASDSVAAYGHDDAYTLARAFVAEQASLKAALFEIVGDADSDSARIAAIKTIDAVSQRILEMLQSLGLATTILEERQISAAIEQWSGLDRREIMFELTCHDPAARQLMTQAVNALHDGDPETAERLWAELDTQVSALARKKIREEILEFRRRHLEETGVQV
jgi:hypothetical protein